MLVAIEGIDGAGKRTQAELLKARAERSGLRANIISFPRYGQTVFARSIASYLNGDFGPLHSIDPRFSALLYAGDRCETRDYLKSLAESSDVLILDRYCASNFAYQAARIDATDRWQFINWIAEIEHEAYRLPQADQTVLLDLPVEIAAGLIRHKDKSTRAYTDSAADIHERDLVYLSQCRDTYHALAEARFRSIWSVVSGVGESGELLDTLTIHETIWACIQALSKDPDRASVRP